MTGTALVDTNILVYRFDPARPPVRHGARHQSAARLPAVRDDTEANADAVQPAMYTISFGPSDVPIVQRPRIQPFQG